jgi:hypothetical protein
MKIFVCMWNEVVVEIRMIFKCEADNEIEAVKSCGYVKFIRNWKDRECSLGRR